MEIEITQDVLDDFELLLQTTNKIVKVMRDSGLSYPALSFILQNLINAVDEAQERLDNT